MSQTLTNIRVRELQRDAEDRATEPGLPYPDMCIARDTALALAELHEFRVKLDEAMRGQS